MTTWDLARLRYTVRKITGMFDKTQLPDNSIGFVSVSNPPGVDDYINDFYLLDFDEQLRTLKLKDWYTFTTIPNVGAYNVPQTIFQLEPPIYVDNYEIAWHQSPQQFYRIWPELNFIDAAIATGNATVGPYTFQLTQGPVQQGTVVIGNSPNLDVLPSPQYETFTDQEDFNVFVNPGVLTGSLGGTGTIDYLSGNVSITYASVLPLGTNINAHYHPYVASRPRDALFFQQNLYLRAIPNDAYSVKIVSYVQPTVAIANSSQTKPQFDGTLTDSPLWNEWWQCIAYGAALKIIIENGDHEEYARNQVYFENAKLLAQRRCLKQLANQRIPTRYADNANGGSAGWPVFPLY